MPLFEQLVCPGPVPDGVDFFLSASSYTHDEQVAAFKQTDSNTEAESMGGRPKMQPKDMSETSWMDEWIGGWIWSLASGD